MLIIAVEQFHEPEDGRFVAPRQKGCGVVGVLPVLSEVPPSTWSTDRIKHDSPTPLRVKMRRSACFRKDLSAMKDGGFQKQE